MHGEKRKEAKSGKDLRKEVTRRLIWEAMFSLLEEQSFSSITVKEICKQAYINRSTFYAHFADKFELLRYGMTDVVLKEAGITNSLGVPLLDTLPHAALFRYVYSHQEFWSNIFDNAGMDSFVAESMLMGTRGFFGGTRSKNEDDDKLPPADVVAEMYFGAVGRLTQWWLSEHCETPIDKLTGWVDQIWRFGTKVTLKDAPGDAGIEFRYHGDLPSKKGKD